jgi:hypothetical protein
MALLPEQLQIAAAFGYTPATEEERDMPADTSLCNRKVEIIDGWPCIKFNGSLYNVPTTEEVEEWVFDSVCFTPDEDEVEPDHPHSWLSILGLI